MRVDLSGGGWTLTGWHRNQWRLVNSAELQEPPVPAVAPLPALVPGAVQTDLMRAGLLPEIYLGLNSLQAEWVTHREWSYERRFPAVTLAGEERLVLHCEGLDCRGEIFVNDRPVQSFEGMFSPVRVDISQAVRPDRENLLRIVFRQPPEIDGQYGYTSRVEDVKARFSYGWDWCPRAVPVGIWDDIFLAVHRRLCVRDLYARGEAARGGWRVAVDLSLEVFCGGLYELELRLRGPGRRLRWTIRRRLAPGTRSLHCALPVPSPALWWPHGCGRQDLYRLAVRIRDEGGGTCAEETRVIGFRRVRLVPTAGADGALPYGLEINGRRMPIKGVNWVPLTPFYGEARRAGYEKVLGRFRDMGCTVLRVWGGGIVEKQDFYTACDRMGLLVWQEFPLTSSGIDNRPNEQPAYLDRLREAAEAFIRRARSHPSHAVWCGGNELMDDGYVPVGADHPTIRLLQELVRRMDRRKPFLPASPSGPRFTVELRSVGRNVHHDVHGPWKYLGEKEHYALFNADDAILRTETGCPAAARYEALRHYADGRELWPPDEGNPYWAHRGAWWIQRRELDRLFGGWEKGELRRYLAFSRYLQAEALRYAAARTLMRWPRAAGFLVWMGNESFPNAANTSVLEFDGSAKPAYYALRRVFGPLFAGLVYPSVVHEPGSPLDLAPFALRAGQPAPECRLRVSLHDARGEVVGEAGWPGHGNRAAGAAPAPAAAGPAWRAPEARGPALFFVRVEAAWKGRLRARETYVFCTRGGPGQPPLAAMRRIPPCRLAAARTESGACRVTNVGRTPAVGLSGYDAEVGAPLGIDDGFVTLFPGESIELTGELFSADAWPRRLRFEALNERVIRALRPPQRAG